MIQKLRNISYETHLNKRMWINNTRNQETESRSDRNV